jgi:hypothetical protein
MDAYRGQGRYKSETLHDEKLKGGELRRYLFLLPRGTFKTSIATVAFSAWIMLQNDPPLAGGERQGWDPPPSFNRKMGYDQRILVGSEVEPHSTKFVANIKEHFTRSEQIHELFGNPSPEKRTEGLWTKYESNVTWRMDFRHKEANLTVTSLDSAINSGHYDIAICDDMISEKQVTTDEQITQTVEWYRRLLPLMKCPHPTVIIFIGTRWHDKDLYGHFLDEERGKWEVYRESAERTEEEVAAGKNRYFFPEILGKENLEDLRSSMRPYLFSCQYYNDPIAATDALFKPEYFEKAYYTLPAGDALKKWLANKTVITTVDPASSQEKRACHRVITTWAWDHRGVGWCLELYREREVNPAEWMMEVFRQYEKWGATQVGVEQLPIYKFAADQISQEHNMWPPFIELKHSKRKKELRIAGLEPLARTGRIKLQEQHSAFEEEALRFPRGRYKDALDASAYQLDLAFSGRLPVADPPPEGSQEFLDAMVQEVQEKRLARLKIGTYAGADRGEFSDWYND